jgi:PadR family transcriptional regulator, regulatory protein AphA
MDGRRLTAFEHILLGLICLSPSSGYDLKRMFASTPMGVYQPSSGTLYPALRRLEQIGVVQAQTPTGQNGSSARHRRVYEPTPAGRAAHATWLREPIDAATAARDLGLHLMRFVMMEHAFSPEEVVAFLLSLADALTEFIAGLELYAASADPGTRHPRLALEHGLSVHRASLEWAERTIAVLSAQPAAVPNDDGELTCPS